MNEFDIFYTSFGDGKSLLGIRTLSLQEAFNLLGDQFCQQFPGDEIVTLQHSITPNTVLHEYVAPNVKAGPLLLTVIIEHRPLPAAATPGSSAHTAGDLA